MTGDKSKAPSPTQIFTEYLRRTRRRRTPERYMVLECAETCQGHFTAEELCVRLEEASRHVARATVYSTLQLLEECGIVMRHRFKDQR
ncbi:MAG: transcriptional repressor, partial [Muribaculaceae bacterium]|nr:transcriptional repressor [Muribaculaceae bacterium]